MNPLVILALAAGGIGALALSASSSTKTTPKAKVSGRGLAGALGKGAFGVLPPAPAGVNAQGLARALRGIESAVLVNPNVPAARAALAKYGEPQFFQRTFADYMQPGGWTDTLDDSVPSQQPAISRARMIVPLMLGLNLDVAGDLGDAGDGTIGQKAQAVVEGAESAGQIAAGNYAVAVADAYQAVSDWMGANKAEWERINNEKIAIDVAKQILANIVAGKA